MPFAPLLIACGSTPAQDAASAPASDAGASDVLTDGGAAIEGQDPGALPANFPPVDTSIPGHERMLTEAQRIAGAVAHTVYQHTTFIDESTHTYDVDCSGFVNYVMARAVPDALTALQSGTQPRPVAKSYVGFTSGLPAVVSRWERVTRAQDLVAGDILSWLEPTDVVSTSTGHVMIVSAAVTPVTSGASDAGDAGDAGVVTEVRTPVIDSTESGHGPTDPRTINNTTGVGQGTIALVVDSQGAPVAYRWSVEKGSSPHPTTIALAHLR